MKDKKESFRLEKIRRLRAKLEEMQKMRLQRANRRRRKAEDKLETTKSMIDRNNERRMRRQREGCAAEKLQQEWYYQLRLKSEETQRQSRLHHTSQRVRECKDELLQARKNKKMLDKLKERHEERLKKKAKRHEQKMLDDIAGHQYVDGRGGDQLL